MSGVLVGDVLGGKFRVERVIGTGGMGTVVAAHHLQLNDLVALKFLLPEIAAHPDTIARFLREAQSAARIKSEHVTRVFDVGMLDNGAPFMVMEYLEGSDLGAMLERGGPLPIHAAVSFVVQAARAVAEAHSLGIVHRDLKPANLFLAQRRDGTSIVKVLDFGISKDLVANAASVNLTKTTGIMGSPSYMSPEQARSSKSADTRTDIWAFGLILYELLTGLRPFDGETVTETLAAIMTDVPRPPRLLRSEIPMMLEAAILRCLEKNRDRRFATIDELVRAIIGFASSSSTVAADGPPLMFQPSTAVGSSPVGAGAQTGPSAGGSTGAPSTAASWSRTGSGSSAPSTSPRRGAVAFVAVAVVVLTMVAVLASAFVYRGVRARDAASAASATTVASTMTSASSGASSMPSAPATAMQETAPSPAPSIAPPPEAALSAAERLEPPPARAPAAATSARSPGRSPHHADAPTSAPAPETSAAKRANPLDPLNRFQ